MRLPTTNLTSKIKAAYDAFKGASPTGRGSAASSSYEMLAKMFQVSYERTQIHKDLERMDKTDEIVAFSHDAMANRATGMEDPTLDIFQAVTESEANYDSPADESTVKRAQHEITDLIYRADLRNEVWQIARFSVKFGNEFRELLVDAQSMNITGLKQLPEHTMWPRMDERGNRVPGYEQRLETSVGQPIIFTDWEIVHFAFGECDGFLGTPLFGCARKNWKRLNMAEDVTAIQRYENMGPRWEHKVPVGTGDTVQQKQEAIEQFKSLMTTMDYFNQTSNSIEKWEAPTGIKKQFFLPDDGSNRGGTTMMEPSNAQLSNLADLEHFLNRLITASHLPKRYFPFEGSTPKLSEGGGSAEDKHFVCTLMLVQMMIKRGLAAIFDRQLLLKGIDPGSIRYVIKMADISTTEQLRDAQTRAALSNAMTAWLKEYPEMREKSDVMLREFSRMSDTSQMALSKIEIKPKPEPVAPVVADPNAPVDPSATPAPDKRVQLPGVGEPAGRMKV